MAEGTRDVSTDLEKRTTPQQTDKILMVNPTTLEVQYVEAGDLNIVIAGVSPESDDELFDL